MKKVLCVALAAVVSVLAAGCARESAQPETEGGAEVFEGRITVCSREDGSGTRGAFVELFEIEEDGVDNTTVDAEITNSTAVMTQTVAGNKRAIGYVSLGSLSDSVKAVKIDGSAPSAENVKNGSYGVTRPFNIVTAGELSEEASEFVSFILSDEGQSIVEENGYISEGSQGAFEGSGASGKVVVAGSSSVTPVMEKLVEGFKAVNPFIEVDVQMSDSTTGITSVLSGICDIGMASRSLKDSETEQGAQSCVIAIDGIAVIVNNSNPIDALATAEVRSIFTGETTDWGGIAQ